jgi:hypothetical protein
MFSKSRFKRAVCAVITLLLDKAASDYMEISVGYLAKGLIIHFGAITSIAGGGTGAGNG